MIHVQHDPADLSKEGDRGQHRPFPEAYFNHLKLGDDARGDSRAFVKGFDITMMNKLGLVFQRVGLFLAYTVFRAIGELKLLVLANGMLRLFVTPLSICHSSIYLSSDTYCTLT